MYSSKPYYVVDSFTLHFKMKYLGNLQFVESSFVILLIFEAEYVLNLLYIKIEPYTPKEEKGLKRSIFPLVMLEKKFHVFTKWKRPVFFLMPDLLTIEVLNV